VDQAADPVTIGRGRQTALGVMQAAMILGGWLALHIHGVFGHALDGRGLAYAPLLVLLICWLSVGMFIVAHDAMHGSLAPGRPVLNRWIGRLALTLYAGLWFDRLERLHAEHHRRPGTPDDPDFSAAHPRQFWRWYLAFFARYVSVGQLLRLSTAVGVYLFVLGAPLPNLLVFWALPAVLSSLQLFLFGTFLPHRVEERPFLDDHRARTSDRGWLVSLVTCFHFGYHHEHHVSPATPWWLLPRLRRSGSA
jgi:beta-carotene/zeaxanthin 4-ketolase